MATLLKKNLFTIIVIIHVILIDAQLQIWSEPMNTFPTSVWSDDDPVLLLNDTHCPDPKTYCWNLNAPSIMTRSTQLTEEFSSVSLHYSVAGIGLNAYSQCVIQYSLDNVVFNEIMRISTDSPSGITDQWTYTPADGGVISIFTVRLKHSAQSNCYFNEFVLNGVPLIHSTTVAPSVQPTQSPTHYNFTDLQIFFHDGFENGTNWIPVLETNQIEFDKGGGDCDKFRDDGGNRKCLWMEGHTLTSRTISTKGYHHISIRIDIRENGLDAGDLCYLEYKTPNISSYTRVNLANTTSDTVLDHVSHVVDNKLYNDHSRFEIRLGNGGGESSDRCVFENLEIAGILITEDPTHYPTDTPTIVPTEAPTNDPTTAPSQRTLLPSDSPTKNPTNQPTITPTKHPTLDPTNHPTIQPTNDPTTQPTVDPTHSPTFHPTNGPTVLPTRQPTKDPTQKPSESPSNKPSSKPTNSPTMDPTTEPTFSPTNAPTVDPTVKPTKYPTNDPTVLPTKQPTEYPTKDPSESPSNQPTTSPMIKPTQEPTTAPSNAPTDESCAIVAIATWSSAFLSIDIALESVCIYMFDTHSMINDCEDIFDANTFDKLDGSNSICTWHDIQLQNAKINIQLSSSAILDLNNAFLSIKPNAFRYRLLDIETFLDLNHTINITAIGRPEHIANPQIVTNIRSEIASCDDLILDARSTTHLGGRNNAVFKWHIADINVIRYGAFVTISNEDLSTLMGAITIELTVTNWYGGSSSLRIQVYKSSLNVIPDIKLFGINEYSKNDDKLLNGKIYIYSSIVFRNNCDGNDEEIALTKDNYSIHWFVKATTQNADDVIDVETLNALKAYVSSQIGSDSVTIDASLYLQSGLMYDFTMNFKCDGVAYECHTNQTHSVVYKYGDIQCKIMGGDVELYGITMNSLLAYEMTLNGDLFSYDPDNVSSDNLYYKWKCVDNVNEERCTDLLLDDADASVLNTQFDTLSVDVDQTEYDYTFTMEVYDKNNILYRDHCFDSVQFTSHIAMDSAEDSALLLIVSTTEISNRLNVNDKCRIIANIVNENEIETDLYVIQHEWIETNSLLSSAEIIRNNDAASNSLNLILRENVLTSGKSYTFQLQIFIYDTNKRLIAHGNSSNVEIYVLRGPQIMDNSFSIAPICTNGAFVYENINDYVQKNVFSLSVSADGDHVPLLYQFTLNNVLFLHPNLLSLPYIDDVYLPIGTNTFIANVYDSTLSKSTASISCSILLNSDSECIQQDAMFTKKSKYWTDYEKTQYILQQSLVYLKYLYDYRNTITKYRQCLSGNLEMILLNLNGDFGSNFVVLLSQVLQLLIDIVNDQPQMNDIEAIEALLRKTIDPSAYIRDVIGYENVESLYVSTESIVRNVARIKYEEQDITEYLSPIITQDAYKHLFYSLSSSLMKWIRNTNNIQIFDLLSAAMHIASLSSISTSIPGEQISFEMETFSLYSTRAVNGNNINVRLQNISVYVPGDVLQITDQNNDSPFQATDIFMVAMNSTQQSNVSVTQSEMTYGCAKNGDGILSEERVDITINRKGENASSHLSSDIQFEFNCDPVTGCNDDDICMWFNVSFNIWQSDGCDTTIDDAHNKIICSCSHLTTFATIHNIHRECSPFIKELFASKYWDYINWLSASLFLITAIYIIREIYPFFVDKLLSAKQISVAVMCCMMIICVLYFIICLQFHLLKYCGVNDLNLNMITFWILLIQFICFVIYSLILYTWFSIAHGLATDSDDLSEKIRKRLLVINIVLFIFFIVSYIGIITESTTYFIYIEALWSFVLLSICIIFVIYAFRIKKILSITTKISKSQRFGKQESKLAKRLLTINAFIVSFFIVQTVSCVYFTVVSDRFGVIHRALDLFINWLFIVLLCYMYRDSMRRTVVTEAANKYKFTKYHCHCNQWCALNREMFSFDRVRGRSKGSKSSRDSHANATGIDIKVHVPSATKPSNRISTTQTTQVNNGVSPQRRLALPAAINEELTQSNMESTVELHPYQHRASYLINSTTNTQSK